jgi:hypothetical protein
LVTWFLAWQCSNKEWDSKDLEPPSLSFFTTFFKVLSFGDFPKDARQTTYFFFNTFWGTQPKYIRAAICCKFQSGPLMTSWSTWTIGWHFFSLEKILVSIKLQNHRVKYYIIFCGEFFFCFWDITTELNKLLANPKP